MGIVVKPEVAFKLCHGYEIDGELILWSDGVIGTLTDEQEKLCKYIFAEKGKYVPERLRKRLLSFKRASKECSKEVEKYPKGKRLIPYLKCMEKKLEEVI